MSVDSLDRIRVNPSQSESIRVISLLSESIRDSPSASPLLAAAAVAACRASPARMAARMAARIAARERERAGDLGVVSEGEGAEDVEGARMAASIRVNPSY